MRKLNGAWSEQIDYGSATSEDGVGYEDLFARTTFFGIDVSERPSNDWGYKDGGLAEGLLRWHVEPAKCNFFRAIRLSS